MGSHSPYADLQLNKFNALHNRVCFLFVGSCNCLYDLMEIACGKVGFFGKMGEKKDMMYTYGDGVDLAGN